MIVWDLKTRRSVLAKQAFPHKICQMSFYRTGEFLAVILASGEAKLLSAESLQSVASLENAWALKDQSGKYYKGEFLPN